MQPAIGIFGFRLFYVCGPRATILKSPTHSTNCVSGTNAAGLPDDRKPPDGSGGNFYNKSQQNC